MARPPASLVGKFTGTARPSRPKQWCLLSCTCMVHGIMFISYHRRTDHMREQTFKTCHTTHKRRYSRRVPNKFYASARRHSRWHLILAQTLHET
jgi:hypothetical protein